MKHENKDYFSSALYREKEKERAKEEIINTQ